MTYTNAEKMIKNAPETDVADDLGQVLNRLGNPEKRIGIIKVYGGSGKSSVCTLLSAVLSAAGYRVGRLTTPFVHSIPNSICIYEKPVSIDFFTKSADKVYKAICDIKKSDTEHVNFAPSKHTLLYATAFYAFGDADCDYAVIEIPTDNVSHSFLSSPLISVISSTDSADVAKSICAKLDRNGKEVVSAMQSREVYKIISDKCAETNTRLTMPIKNSFLFMGSAIKHTKFTYNGTIHSNGCGAYYQIYNLLTVLEAAESLRRCGIKIAGTDVCSAVLCEGIPLRFEIISVMPTIIVDRADTDERRKALVGSLKTLGNQISSKPIVICDKESKKTDEEFLLADIHTKISEVSKKELKKHLRGVLPTLDESSTLIILGSSEYCEESAKLTKEILM